MQRTFRTTSALASVALILALATPALAGTSQKVFITDGTTLAGTEVEQGFYKLLYKKNGSKNSVVVKLQRNGKTFAVAEGTRESRDAIQQGGLAYRNGSGGSREIAEIRIGGTKQVIVIDG